MCFCGRRFPCMIPLLFYFGGVCCFLHTSGPTRGALPLTIELNCKPFCFFQVKGTMLL